MVTRDVLKVLKLHSPTARAILRTFKTSLVLINPEMHSRSYDFLYMYNFLAPQVARLISADQDNKKEITTFHCEVRRLSYNIRDTKTRKGFWED